MAGKEWERCLVIEIYELSVDTSELRKIVVDAKRTF